MGHRPNGSRPTPIPYDVVEDLCSAIVSEVFTFIEARKNDTSKLGDTLIYDYCLDPYLFTHVDGSPFTIPIVVCAGTISDTGVFSEFYQKSIKVYFSQYGCMVAFPDQRNELLLFVFLDGELSAKDVYDTWRNDASMFKLFKTSVLETLVHELTHCIEYNIHEAPTSHLNDADYINNLSEFSALKQEVWLSCRLFKKEFESEFKGTPKAISDFLSKYCVSFSEYKDALSAKNLKAILSLAYTNLYA